MAQIGPVSFVHMTEGLDAAGEAMHGVELFRAIDCRPPGARVGVLYEVPHALGVSALGRSSIAKQLNERRARLTQTTAGFALATPSAFVRGMLQAVLWVATPPYPHTMVADRASAIAFLARHIPGLDPAYVEAECARLLVTHRARMAPAK